MDDRHHYLGLGLLLLPFHPTGRRLLLLPPFPSSSRLRLRRCSLHRDPIPIRITMAAKAKAIRVHELGGPEVMRWEEVEVGDPKEGEIRIRTTAIGVNFIDVHFRKGVYAAPAMPFTPGMEAVGVVTAVGPGLTGRKVGDVVAYAGDPMGSYAQEQILPASVAVPVPPSVDHKQAASVMLKGMTAHYLLRRVFKVQSDCPGTRCCWRSWLTPLSVGKRARCHCHRHCL
ncbi:unnamed protein product [Urochloa humidicola]